MKKCKSVLVLLLCSCLLFASSCMAMRPRQALTVTVWHNYFGGGPMQNKMDSLIDEFNRSTGREQGILVNVTLIGTSSDLVSNIDAILRNEPGAPSLPHIAILYPRTANALRERGFALELGPQFSQAELAAFKTEFLEEGKLDGALYVLPANKSTEVIFLNQSFFDRAAPEINASTAQLSRTEDLFALAERYYAWSDAQTPEKAGDGRCFLAIDSWYNFFQIYMRQNGASLVTPDGRLNASDPIFLKLWELMADAALGGSLSCYPGYASEISRTGDTVCSIGSTAGVLYYGQEVTTAEGKTEAIEYQVYPFPVAQGCEPIAIQRGGGLVVTKSEPKIEQAAVTFLKWFTETERNYNFTLNSGYMPVKSNAYGDFMLDAAAASDSEMMRSLQETLADMSARYRLDFAPLNEQAHSLNERFDKTVKSALELGRTRAAQLERGTPAYLALKEELLAGILSDLQP